MASAQVLQTPELLEMILLSVPCRDLLLSQRVDRMWRGTILGSLKLKRALFMVPAGPVVMPHGSKRRRYITETWSDVEEEDPYGDLFRYAVDEKAIEAYSVTMNPLMPRLFPILNFRQKVGDITPPVTSRTRAALTRREASWRKMLVCQPPVSHIWARDSSVGEKPGFNIDNVEPTGLGIDSCQPRSWARRWGNDDGIGMFDIAVRYHTFHATRATHMPTRFYLHDVFTWWRPRPEHTTAETIAADAKPYSWEEETGQLNVLREGEGDCRPDLCSTTWEHWTS